MLLLLPEFPLLLILLFPAPTEEMDEVVPEALMLLLLWRAPWLVSLLLLMKDVIAAATATLNLGSEAMADTLLCWWWSPEEEGSKILLLVLRDVFGLVQENAGTNDDDVEDEEIEVRSRTSPFEGSILIMLGFDEDDGRKAAAL